MGPTHNFPEFSHIKNQYKKNQAWLCIIQTFHSTVDMACIDYVTYLRAYLVLESAQKKKYTNTKSDEAWGQMSYITKDLSF